MAHPEPPTDATRPQQAGPGQAAATVLELHVGEMRQLFNAMDPAPFRERDLDPNAEAYIVDWGHETRAGAQLGLVVRLSREAASSESAAMLKDAVHAFFRQRATATRQKLRQLLRTGRISLVIGLTFLAGAIVVGDFVANLLGEFGYGIIKESFVIGGWVALWRPLEIFLYDWWPVRAEARLYDRLGEMSVAVYGAPAGRDANP